MKKVMEQEHSQRLKSLRERISLQNAWGAMAPYSNCFQSEYMADRDHHLEWLTGFKGSAGLAIVLETQAALFVDGRYTLQAHQEVDGHSYSVQPCGFDSIKEWLGQQSTKGGILLYDSWLQTVQQVAAYRKHLDPLGIILKSCDANLVEEIWYDRPAVSCHPFLPHPERWSGKNFKEKLKPILEEMHLKNADYFIVTCPESISWLLNIRGNDTPFTPSCQAFVIIDHQGQVQGFTDLKKITDDVRAHCGPSVSWFNFQLFLDVASSFVDKKVLADFSQLPQKVFDCLKKATAKVFHEPDPCILGRALKNEVEQKGAEVTHQRDSVAVINFLAWLERTYPLQSITESKASDYLLEQRQKQANFQGESFPTISAVGPNAAIVHYHPDPSTSAVIGGNSLYLIDSGGQYLDGTTDTTRTVAIGKPTAEQKDRFTRVLKGHIALSTIVFPSGTTGQQLDVFARQFLWQVGLDYEHSTGHGIGSYLNVHEGPHRIGKRGEGAVLQLGMLVTNEPGYYKTGEYGIRIESVMLVVPVQKNEGGTFLGFKTLTLVPIDHHLIDISLLTAQEIKWINDYHARIYNELSARVDEQTEVWLQQATESI